MSLSHLIGVTYQIHSEKPLDLQKKALGIALGQTTDTWTPNERSGLSKLEKHKGQVLGAQEQPQTNGAGHTYRITVGYPAANTENDIPTLLTMIFGKISMDGQIKLQSIDFPPSYLRGKGPRFGIEGLRKLVKEPTAPLTMAIFKPCVGLTPKELGRMFFELAIGGMHLVKDDEILPDLAICPVEKRLEACLKAGEQAFKQTQRKTLYAVNLTGRISQLQSKARRLKKLGAECFLLNVLSYGYGALEELRDVGVPIMAHPALAGALSGSAYTGISYGVLLGSLMRLGGADMVLFPSSYGTVALPESETKAITEQLTTTTHWGQSPMTHLKRSFPGPSAGIHPGLVPRILQDYGNDVIINAGGGVHGHPQGARAGALAFQQAIQGHTQAPELAQALSLWGQK